MIPPSRAQAIIEASAARAQATLEEGIALGSRPPVVSETAPRVRRGADFRTLSEPGYRGDSPLAPGAPTAKVDNRPQVKFPRGVA